MAWTLGKLRIATCRPTAHDSFTNEDNSTTTGIALTLANAPSTSQADPFPTVVKSAPNATTQARVYGAFSTFTDNGEDSTSAVGDRRVGVITGGIVEFTLGASASAADPTTAIGQGITGSDTITDADGSVILAATGGRGSVVAIGDAGRTVWVDLDRRN